ncbi:hypothetical protein FJZ28_02290 [Candidatus Peregrinibacteria bacterium]|nr:hypothetical protein [Candidatus Peregrinibacteria bacterium]
MYLRYRETDSRRAYRWSIVLFACGLLSKVSIVFAPVVLLFTDLLTGRPLNANTLKTLSPYVGMSLLLGSVALFGKAHQLDGAGIGELLLLGTHSTRFILQKMVMPTGLTLFYPFEGAIAFSEPKLLISVAGTLLLLAMIPLLRKRFHIGSYGIVFFFLLLSPSFLNAWKNGYLDITFDKYVYAAMPGLLLPVGFLLANLLSQKTLRAITIALCILLAPLTFVQARTWRDSTTLLEHNIRLQPSSTHALVNMGTTTYQAGDSEGH